MNYENIKSAARKIGAGLTGLALMVTSAVHAANNCRSWPLDKDYKAKLEICVFTYDNKVNETRIRMYDSQGMLIKRVWDMNGDFKPESSVEYEYDSNGLRIRSKWDRDGDGTIEETEEYKYNSGGNMVSETIRNADGKITQITLYEYSHNGRKLLRRNRDTNGDGKTDKVWTREDKEWKDAE